MSRTLKLKQTRIFVDDEGVTQEIKSEDSTTFDTITEGSLFWDVGDTSTYHESFGGGGTTAVAIEIHNTSETEELELAFNCGDYISLGPGDRDTKILKTGPSADQPYFRIDAYPLNTPASQITAFFRIFKRIS